MSFNIVQVPNPLLRKKLRPVKFLTPKILKIIGEMLKTLEVQHSPEGVGLAANQVGIDLQICIVRNNLDEKIDKKEEFLVMINPAVVEKSKKLTPNGDKNDEHLPLEGCLSLCDYYGRVRRHGWVVVRYQTLRKDGPDLLEKTEKFEGMTAIIVQHEIDHLNGELFIDKVLEQKATLYHLKGKNKKGEDIWEKVKL